MSLPSDFESASIVVRGIRVAGATISKRRRGRLARRHLCRTGDTCRLRPTAPTRFQPPESCRSRFARCSTTARSSLSAASREACLGRNDHVGRLRRDKLLGAGVAVHCGDRRTGTAVGRSRCSRPPPASSTRPACRRPGRQGLQPPSVGRSGLGDGWLTLNSLQFVAPRPRRVRQRLSDRLMLLANRARPSIRS